MRILTVVDYDEMWPALFESERTLLQMTLGMYTLCFVILENHALWLVGQGGTLI